MRKIVWLFALALLASCEKPIICDAVRDNGEPMEFYATFDESTRIYIDEQVRTRWHADDRIALFRGNTYLREYAFTGVTGANGGGFRQISVDDEIISGLDLDANYAFYPYQAGIMIDETDKCFSYNLPAKQTYAEQSYAAGANPMVAVTATTEDYTLKFKNVCSYVKVMLYGEGHVVESLTFESNGGEPLAGPAKIYASNEGDPTCELSGTTSSVITLDCGEEGVAIGTTAEEATPFWLVVPPGVYNGGITLTVRSIYGEEQSFVVDSKVTFNRNKYITMTREMTIPAEPAIIEILDEAYNHQLTSDGQQIYFDAYSEFLPEMVVVGDWLAVSAEQDADDGTITHYSCEVSANTTDQTRMGYVILKDSEGYTQSVVTITQSGVTQSELESFSVVGSWKVTSYKSYYNEFGAEEVISEIYDNTDCKLYTLYDDFTGVSYQLYVDEQSGEVLWDECAVEYSFDQGILTITEFFDEGGDIVVDENGDIIVEEGGDVVVDGGTVEYWPWLVENINVVAGASIGFNTISYYVHECDLQSYEPVWYGWEREYYAACNIEDYISFE